MSWLSEQVEGITDKRPSLSVGGRSINLPSIPNPFGREDTGWYGVNDVIPESEVEAPTAAATMAETMAALLEYNPELAAQAWELTSKYGPQYAELYRQMASKDRSAELADVLGLAPKLQQIRTAGERPDITQMRNLLYSGVLDELRMGGKLTPQQNLQANESLRSAEVARGVHSGQPSANREAVRKALEGMNLLGQRQQKASGILAQESASSPEPFSAILGRPATSANVGITQGVNAAQAITPALANANVWNASNAQTAADQYNLTMQIARANPYLRGPEIFGLRM